MLRHCASRCLQHSWSTSFPLPVSPPQEAKAYAKLRVERMNQRLVGTRTKRAKEEAAKKESDN